MNSVRVHDWTAELVTIGRNAAKLKNINCRFKVIKLIYALGFVYNLTFQVYKIVNVCMIHV